MRKLTGFGILCLSTFLLSGMNTEIENRSDAEIIDITSSTKKPMPIPKHTKLTLDTKNYYESTEAVSPNFDPKEVLHAKVSMSPAEFKQLYDNYAKKSVNAAKS